MTKKLIVIILVGLTGLVSGYFVITRYLVKPKLEIKTAVAKKDNLKISFAIDGNTLIERRDLKFNVSGKVSKVYVKEGQEVKKGQLLVSLDATDVAKNLERDLRDYSIARNNFDETTKVTYPDGATTDTLMRILQNTQYTLDKSVLDVEIQNEALRASKLYSPIAGIVSVVNTKDGETVNTSSANPIVTVTVPGSLVFEAYGEDTEILKIDKNQKTNITIDAIPTVSFPSQVDFISNLATIDTNGLASYKIRAVMSDLRDYKILDGMAGQIEFVTKEKNGVTVVPNTAIFRKDNKSFVNLLIDGKSQEKNVETGFTDGKEVEIVSGLNVGDTVILQ
jgi:RND family efflux transporter MFP subunit